MALQFIDGFSHYPNIMEKWDEENVAGAPGVVISPAVGRFSTGSLGLGPATIGEWVQKNLPTSVSTLVSGFAYKFVNNESAIIQWINNSGTPHLSFLLDGTDGSIKIYRGTTGGTLLASSAAAVLTSAVWQYVEIKAFVDNVNGFVEAKVAGVSVASATTVDTQDDASPLILNYRVTTGTVMTTEDINITDLYILDDTGAAPYNDYVGDVKVSVLRPEANGALNNFTPTGAATNWEAVDDTLMDSDTTRVASGTINARDEYDVESFASLGLTVGTIFGVQVCNACKKTDAGTIGYKDNLTVGSTVFQSAEVFAPAGAYKITTDVHQINPDTSVAWTESTAEAALPGFTLTTKVI